MLLEKYHDVSVDDKENAKFIESTKLICSYAKSIQQWIKDLPDMSEIIEHVQGIINYSIARLYYSKGYILRSNDDIHLESLKLQLRAKAFFIKTKSQLKGHLNEIASVLSIWNRYEINENLRLIFTIRSDLEIENLLKNKSSTKEDIDNAKAYQKDKYKTDETLPENFEDNNIEDIFEENIFEEFENIESYFK